MSGIHDNHRKRIDKKVCELGFEVLEEHEQLEEILFAVIPRGDTNALAHRLIEQFGSLAGVLNADIRELKKIEGVGHRTAVFLISIPQMLGAVERSLNDRKMLKFDCFEDMERFVRSYFFGKLVECAYMFSLNSTYKLMNVTKLSEGVGAETYIYPQVVARQAILDRASAVIIAHNHPCGNLNPSINDVKLSRRISQALAAVEVELYDSVIISQGKCYSMRENGYLDGLCEHY